MPLPVVYVEDQEGHLKRWQPPMAFLRTNEMHLLLLDMIERDACLQEYRDKIQTIMRKIIEDNS